MEKEDFHSFEMRVPQKREHIHKGFPFSPGNPLIPSQKDLSLRCLQLNDVRQTEGRVGIEKTKAKKENFSAFSRGETSR
jgi:hypothetical protein